MLYYLLHSSCTFQGSRDKILLFWKKPKCLDSLIDIDLNNVAPVCSENFLCFYFFNLLTGAIINNVYWQEMAEMYSSLKSFILN